MHWNQKVDGILSNEMPTNKKVITLDNQSQRAYLAHACINCTHSARFTTSEIDGEGRGRQVEKLYAQTLVLQPRGISKPPEAEGEFLTALVCVLEVLEASRHLGEPLLN